ncbi:MAG: hypothetical protein WAU07_01595 [Microgenomates group bacterium]
MKTNTLKLLTTLYNPSPHAVLTLRQGQIHMFLPELSVAGLRSALYRLIDKGLVSNLNLEEGQEYYLTRNGTELVRNSFPALNLVTESWQGKWLQIVFISGPAHDSDFRNLRSILSQRGAQQVTRGVYLLPDIGLDGLLKICLEKYQESIQIQRIEEWLIGGDKRWVIELFDLESLASAYSGISKEIDRLLARAKRLERLTEREKKQFSMVFNRFWEVLGVDCGIADSFIVASPHPISLLSKLQHLAQLGLPQEEF